MDKEQIQIKSKESQAEEIEKNISPEKTAEETREEMIATSEKEVAGFENEGEKGLQAAEQKAEVDGFEVGVEDKTALKELDQKAEVAQGELEREITPNELPEKEKDVESKIEKANIVGITKDRNFPGSVIIKTENAEGRMMGYAIRKDSQGNLEGNEIRYMKDGSIGPVYQLHESSFAKLREQGVLEAYENIPTMKDRSAQVPELLDKKEASKKFLAEEREKLAQEILAERKRRREKMQTLKSELEKTGKIIENLDDAAGDSQYGKLSEMQSEEASATAEAFLSENGMDQQEAEDEKDNLEQLIENSDGLETIKQKLEAHYTKADSLAREKFESIQRSVEQTALRSGVFFVHTIQENERFRHNELSNVSSNTTYKDDASILLALEPTISASSVFSGRSEDGKVSGLWSDASGFLLGGGDIRYASRNDLDSKSEGIKKRIVTNTREEKQSIEDIDTAVSKRGEMEAVYVEHNGVKVQEMGTVYNEFIIDNPKVFGYYQSVGVVEDKLFADGKHWVGDESTKYKYQELSRMKGDLDRIKSDPDYYPITPVSQESYDEKLSDFQKKITEYKKRFEEMFSMGNPLYVMDPDRNVYEYLGVNDDGTVNIGRQLTPEDVATGKAGLPVEKRKELGNNILKKAVFKEGKTAKEAEEIIENL
ncbi:MAG: hypothetical protein WC022_02820 [Parcubacteria group bacterium]